MVLLALFFALLPQSERIKPAWIPTESHAGERYSPIPLAPLDERKKPHWVSTEEHPNPWYSSLALEPPSERKKPAWIWSEPGKRAWYSPFFGSAVGAPGDVDADGIPDLLVADVFTPLCTRTKRSFERHGRAWILSGRDGRVLHDVHAPYGADHNGLACVALADVDGDGSDDYALGWYEGVPERKGHAEIRSGRSGERLVFIDGPADFARFAGNAGDFDGDGRNDVLLAGGNGPLATIRSSVDGSVLQRFESWSGARRAASNPLVVPDTDGDGHDEIAVIAADDPNGCALLCLLDRDTARLMQVFEIAFAPGRRHMNRFSLSHVRARGTPLVLAACATSELVILSASSGDMPSTRPKEEKVEFRSGVASPGDLDADGTDDLWIGVDLNEFVGGGCVFARSGRDDRLLYTFGDDYRADQTGPAYRVGAAVAVVGDIDADGVRDGLAACDHTLAHGDGGMAFAFSGRTGELIFSFARDGDGVRTMRPGEVTAR